MATTRALIMTFTGVGLLQTLSCLAGAAAAQDPADTMSRSILGANPYLSEGATALMLGNYERGVELTHLGLQDVLTTEDRITSLSNLCGGYVGLKEFDVAIVYCNRSLDLDANNWRALQNRAAAYSGLGNVTKALIDIERGLELNPDSEALKITLAIVREQARRLAARPGSSAISTALRTTLPVDTDKTGPDQHAEVSRALSSIATNRPLPDTRESSHRNR